MKYEKRRMAIAMMLLCVPLAGCANTVIANGVPDCAKQIPPSWKLGVPPVDLPFPETLPDGHDNAKPWQEGFIGQTGQLEKANDRTADTDYIYANCLQMHRDAQTQAKKGFFERLFSGGF